MVKQQVKKMSETLSNSKFPLVNNIRATDKQRGKAFKTSPLITNSKTTGEQRVRKMFLNSPLFTSTQTTSEQQ